METRSLDPDDLDAALDIRTRSFGAIGADSVTQWQAMMSRSLEAERAIGAYDGTRLVAVARINDLTQWWAGRSVRMAGIGGVVVAPEHRGQGWGRRLMRAVLERAQALGYPLSALYPATVPVYRAVGYEFAGAEHKITVAAEAVRTMARGAAVETVRVSSSEAGVVLSIMNGLHEGSRDCGPIAWPEDEWVSELDDPAQFAYRADDGFLMYAWDGHDAMQATTLVGGSAETLRTLWAILGSGSSIVKTIKAVVSPHDPIRWLLPDHGLRVNEQVWWMLRLLDVRAAIEGRGFPPGTAVDVRLDLSDAELGHNAGRVRLNIADGSARLEPTRAAGSALQLGPNGLAALYAGTPLNTLRRSGLAIGGRAKEDLTLDAAFAARPFMLDYF